MRFIRAALCILALIAPSTSRAQEAELEAKKMFAMVQEFGIPWGSPERGQKASIITLPDGSSMHSIAHPVREGQPQRLVVLFMSAKNVMLMSSFSDMGPRGKPIIFLRSNFPHTKEEVEAAYPGILKCLFHIGTQMQPCEDMKMLNALLERE